MALKLVRIKKQPTASKASKKKLGVEKFSDAIDVQLRLASGESIKQGRGAAKSWVVDGSDYGEKFVLLPKIGKSLLWPKTAVPLKSDGTKDVTSTLNTLKTEVASGKFNNRIYAVLRSQKKAGKK